MYSKPLSARLAPLGAVLVASLLSACTQSVDAITTSSLGTRSVAYSATDKECMTRAMFFESHRSSREGMIAVGTVVMNRLESGDYPTTVCGVVGQKNQFAPGVLSRKMNSKALPDVQAAAEAVLKGERHPEVGRAKFFHQAGLKFPYKNMHYVTVAGGNAFYEKRSRREREAARQVASSPAVEPKNALPADAMAYDVAPEAADKIGALLASQTRPAE